MLGTYKEGGLVPPFPYDIMTINIKLTYILVHKNLVKVHHRKYKFHWSATHNIFDLVVHHCTG